MGSWLKGTNRCVFINWVWNGPSIIWTIDQKFTASVSEVDLGIWTLRANLHIMYCIYLKVQSVLYYTNLQGHHYLAVFLFWGFSHTGGQGLHTSLSATVSLQIYNRWNSMFQPGSEPGQVDRTCDKACAAASQSRFLPHLHFLSS